MSEQLTSVALEAATHRICAMLEAQASEFDRLDAQTGDGDMGSTLHAIARGIKADTTPFPADLGASFQRLALVIAKTSGSSLSAIAMTGLMSLSATSAGRNHLGPSEFRAGVVAAIAVMHSRSGARLGDKTVLDGLQAIVEAWAGAASLSQMGPLAVSAIEATLRTFHDRPSHIGRARLAANGGVGLDDPGLVALAHIVAVAGDDAQ